MTSPASNAETAPNRPHRVLIVGGGFAGLFAAKALGERRKDADFEVTLLDKRNFHLFQPLLYQVATGGLVVGDIATPHRVMLRRYKNVRCLTGTAYDLDPEQGKVYHEFGELEYDTLIVGTGVKHSYFGHDEWRPYAPGLKTVEHALEMRRKIFSAFERAEATTDPERRKAMMTFVVVGAGPTGVELAGALGELAHHTMVNDFRSIDPREVTILLVEGAPRVLPVYDDKLSASAEKMLGELGVTVFKESFVENIEPGRVTIRRGKELERVHTETVLWAAGVTTSAFGRVLAERTGVELDRQGKLPVERDMSLKGHPGIFVVGDLGRYETEPGKALPGLAPVAIQQGEYVARLLKARHKGSQIKPFRYVDKGTMAVIGRNRAVGDLNFMRITGFFAWALWVAIHIWSLMNIEQRLSVMTNWAWKYITRKSGSRLITGDPPHTREIQSRYGNK